MRAVASMILALLVGGCCCRRPCCPASVPAAPAAPAPLAASAAHVVELYAVADLIHAVEVLGGRVDIGSPEESPMERLLFTLAVTASNASPGGVEGPISELRAQGGTNLVAKATPSAQAAISGLLSSWRETWKARWPEAFPASLPAAPEAALSGLVDLDAVE
jgi:hypothetical protein